LTELFLSRFCRSDYLGPLPVEAGGWDMEKNASEGRRMMRFLLALLLCTLATGVVIGDEPDSRGCRVLSKLPEPGVHPRVFFTADELPRIRQRLDTTTFGEKFKKTVLGVVQTVKNRYAGLAALDAEDITPEVVEKHMRPDEGRNIQWGVASVYASVYDDVELKDFMARVITSHGRILLASKELSISGTARLWDSTNFTVGESWTIGAAGFAISYDVLFNDMTEQQRSIVRRAIATATKGRTPYGTGLPKGFGISNHFGYHGDLAVLLCAIEGEAGYDRPTYENIRRILLNHWDAGYTELGASHEDGYMQLGLRAGSRGLMALARRGDNIFATEKYRNYLEYVALEFEPFPGGAFVGGASGSSLVELYPTAIIVGRYMYPKNPAANFIYRHTLGDDYTRRIRWQGHLDFMIFGGDWQGAKEREQMLRESGLPLTRFYPERGKLVSRSDWSDNALQFTFDARPDAFTIGHDKVERGHFTLSALGRNWASNGWFSKWDRSDENSLVHIDGKAQGWKAPSVRFQAHSDSPVVTTGSADLKYAYDWQWSPPWPSKDRKFSSEWEPEHSDPRDLGWPREHAPDWLPSQIYGSASGYVAKPPAGNWMHRRPYNPVLRATRATAAVRGHHPYVVIVDDIQKDAHEHTYSWYMQLPTDLELKSHGDGDFLLGEVGEATADGRPAPGSCRLLVRVLQADATTGAVTGRVEDYVAHVDKRRNEETPAKRLILEVKAIAPNFKVMLFPHVVGEPLPSTAWEAHGRTLNVRWDDQQDVLVFAPGEDAYQITARQNLARL
jgi:hypothetical protein